MSGNEKSRRLLILASKLGYQTRSFAEAAEKLGVEVVFGTDRCHKLDDPWSDGALPLHFHNPSESAREIAREFRDKPVNAILALGDRPTSTAAFAAQALGITGNPPEAVEACRNKLRQREILHAAGVSVPTFFAFFLGEDLATVLPRVKFPCVVKPLSLGASQGVIRANNSEEFTTAVRRIHALLESPDIQVLREPNLDRVLVEAYIPGQETAVEGLIDSGRLRVLAIFDKPDPLEGPYFEETIYVTPSRLPEQQITAIENSLRASATALGLSHGPVHAEFRIGDGAENTVWPIEIAPRPIGGLCARALRFEAQTGSIGLEELLLRHAVEMTGADAPREMRASGVMMIPVPESGIFSGVAGLENGAATPGVTEILITARVHDYIAAWPEGSSYLGFIFAVGENPEFVETALRQAHEKLHFQITPRLAVRHPSARS